MNENKELKPCPFCGCKDIMYSNKTSNRGKRRHVTMYCNRCHAYGPRVFKDVPANYYVPHEWDRIGINDAIYAWNTRQSSALLDEAVELLKKSTAQSNIRGQEFADYYRRKTDLLSKLTKEKS